MLFSEKVYIYLYFLQEKNLIHSLIKTTNEELLPQTHFYAFCLFLAKEKNIENNELFFVDSNGARHNHYEMIMGNLYFHGFIDDDDKITEKGIEYFTSLKEKFKILHSYLKEFLIKYRDVDFLEYHKNYVDKNELGNYFYPVTTLYQNSELYSI